MLGAWSFGVGATSGADSKNGIGTASTILRINIGTAASTADASASAKLGVRCCSWEIKKSAWREWWQLGNCQWLGI